MGNIWEFMAIYGNSWQFMAISHIVMAIYRETYGKHMGNIWENGDFFESFFFRGTPFSDTELKCAAVDGMRWLKPWDGMMGAPASFLTH